MAESNSTTLFVRGVPRRVVRHAKAAAAREGRTLGGWVTDRLARAAGLSGEQAGADALQPDIDWYEKHEARLARRYAGEYLAIVNQAVVDHDAVFEDLAARVFTRFGVRPIYMPRVGRYEVRVRSPRRPRS